jgi:hypothetical protein
MTAQMRSIHEETTVTAEKFEQFQIATLQRITALEQAGMDREARLRIVEHDVTEHIKGVRK